VREDVVMDLFAILPASTPGSATAPGGPTGPLAAEVRDAHPMTLIDLESTPMASTSIWYCFLYY